MRSLVSADLQRNQPVESPGLKPSGAFQSHLHHSKNA